jgi:hypothetical protein
VLHFMLNYSIYHLFILVYINISFRCFYWHLHCIRQVRTQEKETAIVKEMGYVRAAEGR